MSIACQNTNLSLLEKLFTDMTNFHLSDDVDNYFERFSRVYKDAFLAAVSSGE